MASTLFFICGFFYIIRQNLYNEIMSMEKERPEPERKYPKETAADQYDHHKNRSPR